jgi:hypothetical protein
MWSIEHKGISQTIGDQEQLKLIARLMREWNISYIIKSVEFTMKGKVEHITGMYDGK